MLARKKPNLLTAALNYCAHHGLPNPWSRFAQNRATAKHRGIDFRLTFDEWWTLWAVHYHERGTKRGEYCLCRYLDMGCYEVDNVRVDLAVNNIQEAHVAIRMKTPNYKHSRGAPNLAAGIFWSELREYRNPLEILLEQEAELIG